MITPLSITIKWDLVPGSVKYDLLRDGVKVTGTKTALSAHGLKILPGGHVWEIVASPSGHKQVLNMRLEG